MINTKIKNSKTLLYFRDLSKGDYFARGDEVYLKTDKGAVNLKHGKEVMMADFEEVYKIIPVNNTIEFEYSN